MHHKVIGYFSYTEEGMAICDGDACIISSSEELMQKYLSQVPVGSEQKIIKKVRFGEIMHSLGSGAAYAFDEGSYRRILPLIEHLGIDYLPSVDDFFSVKSPTDMHFIRIQLF